MTDGIIQKVFDKHIYNKDNTIKHTGLFSKYEVLAIEQELIEEIKKNKDKWYEGISLDKLIGDVE